MACMVATTTAAPVMSLFMSSIDALGFRLKPPESNVTPFPTSAWVGASPPWRYCRIRKRGGSSEPAATPSSPPNRSRRIRCSIPNVNRDAGVLGHDADAIGQLRRRLVAGRRIHEIARQVDGLTDDLGAPQSRLEPRGVFVALAGLDDQAERSRKAWRLASVFRSPGPRVPTIAPSIRADATARGSTEGGSATATLSRGFPASRLASAKPAENAAAGVETVREVPGRPA